MLKKWRQHNFKLQQFERRLLPKRYKLVAGVDEAGRGPLAGPVVACAVIVEKNLFTAKIFDSKKLSFSSRQKAFAEIINKAHVGIGVVDNATIDKENILEATILAIRQALHHLVIKPQFLLVDGRFKEKSFPVPYLNVVKGDSLCFSIACASIVAKVVRDNLMADYAARYPQYGFERNRGYYSQVHIQAIKKFGLTPIHRRSFQPLCNELTKL